MAPYRIEGSVALQGSDGRGDDPHRIRPVPEPPLSGIERLSEPDPMILQDGVRNIPRPPVDQKKGPVPLDLRAVQRDVHLTGGSCARQGPAVRAPRGSMAAALCSMPIEPERTQTRHRVGAAGFVPSSETRRDLEAGRARRGEGPG